MLKCTGCLQFDGIYANAEVYRVFTVDGIYVNAEVYRVFTV
jgi:hypothetical protein